MSWDLNSDRPIYTQILEIIQMQIVSGHYKPGDKLPSVRELAAIACVNPNTMQKAFSELERSGLIITQRTSGRLVTDNIQLIKHIQQELAQNQITAFFQKMEELGFEKQEIAALLEHAIKEE